MFIVAACTILLVIILLVFIIGKQRADIFSYTNNPETESDQTNTSRLVFALERDERSDHVRTLQRYLKRFGYYDGDESGNFDDATKAAYLAFCQMNGLKESVNKDGYMMIMEDEWNNIESISPF